MKQYLAFEKFDLNRVEDADFLPQQRLGKLVEQFLLFDMSCLSQLKVLESNIQIFNGKQTIGELDCICEYEDSVYHLEFVYKFYLYDPSIAKEMERWIGPNRNDSLVKKLQKLKEKQFPLLYNPQTESQLGLEVNNIKKSMLFQAQLFVPANLKTREFEQVNNDCIVGVYYTESQFKQLNEFLFYIPI